MICMMDELRVEGEDDKKSLAELPTVQASVRDEVEIFLFAEVRRQKGIKFITEVTKAIEARIYSSSYLISRCNSSCRRTLPSTLETSPLSMVAS